MSPTNEICSAMFVDFDNIFSRLRDMGDERILDTFATKVDLWVNWLEKEMSTAHFGDEKVNRRILIRKCYINPAGLIRPSYPNQGTYSKFRPYFTRAAFEVIDCPQLTKEGKTSTDIHMVMDIMDTLRHPNHFDEFILFSADADFTPVLLRVRQYNRRSVVLGVGYTSPAYQSASDYLLPPNTYYKDALKVTPAEPEEEQIVRKAMAASNGEARALDRLADALLQALSVSDIIMPEKLPSIYLQSPEFRESKDWLGYRYLNKLTQAVVARRPVLEYVKDSDEGDWFVRMRAEESKSIAGPAAEEDSLPGKAKTPVKNQQREALLAEIAQVVQEKVQQSLAQVPLAALADLVKNKFNGRLEGSGWLGHSTFKALLSEMDLGGLKINDETPGFVYDPMRHDLSAASGIEYEFKQKYPEIEPVVKEIHQLTNMPYLLPEHYGLILRQLARTINEEGFNMTTVTRLVRDRCIERRAPVARSHVNFVVNGIYFAGHSLGKETETAEGLACHLEQNTLNLCTSAQMVLDDREKELVHEWLFSKLDEQEQPGENQPGSVE